MLEFKAQLNSIQQKNNCDFHFLHKVCFVTSGEMKKLYSRVCKYLGKVSLRCNKYYQYRFILLEFNTPIIYPLQSHNEIFLNSIKMSCNNHLIIRLRYSRVLLILLNKENKHTVPILLENICLLRMILKCVKFYQHIYLQR